jgi:hypothetical protein
MRRPDGGSGVAAGVGLAIGDGVAVGVGVATGLPAGIGEGCWAPPKFADPTTRGIASQVTAIFIGEESFES